MSAGAIRDRAQTAPWQGLKHICYSPWPGPLCAQELCCFIESTSPLPHTLQLPKADWCRAAVSPRAFLACRSSNKASQELILLNPKLYPKCRFILSQHFGVVAEPGCPVLAQVCGCSCCSESSTEPCGLPWAECGSLACRETGPMADGLYRELRGSAQGYNLCTQFHEVPFVEVGWAPAEAPASGGYTSKNHREDTHCFFMVSQTVGLFPISPFSLLKDLRRTFFLSSIITCLPVPFKNRF